MTGMMGTAALLLALRLVGVALQLGTVAFLAHRLSMDGMALFALVFSGFGLARGVCCYGVDQALTRVLAADGACPPLAPRARRQIAAGWLIALAGSGLALLAVALPLALRLPPLQTAAILLALPAYALIGVLAGQMRGLSRPAAAQLPEVLILPALTLALMLLAAQSGRLAAETAIIALAAAGWGALILQLVLALRLGLRGQRPARADITLLLREGHAIFQTQIFAYLATRAPLFSLALVAPPAQVALMEVALRFGSAPTLLTNAVGASFSARFAQLAARRDQAGLRAARRQAGLLGALPAGAYLAVLVLGGGPLLALFLPESYQPAVPAMLLTAAAFSINAGFGPATYLLLMSGQAPRLRRYTLLRLGLLLGLGLPLGALWGAAGIGLALLAAHVVADGGAAREARRLGM
jgi:O-antigen/teichoic acid export membrane protein